MTNKKRILQMVQRWPEDISFDEALYHVYVLKKIDAGLKSLESGPSKDHDEFFDELERLCDEEEAQAKLVAVGPGRSKTPAKLDRRRGRAKNGQVIRKPAKKTRGSAS
jgi:hypothetical protein